jgi:hypothetical protein
MSPDDTASREHRAALAVHALDARDREWMLQRLAASHRALLAPLLAELTALGIPRQLNLLQELEGTRLLADNATSATIAESLVGEPHRLVAHLLAEDGPARAVLQESFGAAHCRAVMAACGPLPAAPALKRAITLAVRDAARMATVAAAKGSAWHRLLRWTSRKAGT